MMRSQNPHPVMSPVVRNVRSLANCPNRQKGGPWGNSQLPRLYETHFRTRWWEGFLSRREFHSLFNPRTEMYPLIFAEQFSRCRYHSPCDFHPVRYTAMVNNYSNRHIQEVVTHQHPAEPCRETQPVALYPAPHPELLALPLLSAVLKTCLPPSQIQKPSQSLQIHCERKLQTGIRDRSSRNCKRKQCQHLDQWCLRVAASIDLVTLT